MAARSCTEGASFSLGGGGGGAIFVVLLGGGGGPSHIVTLWPLVYDPGRSVDPEGDVFPRSSTVQDTGREAVAGGATFALPIIDFAASYSGDVSSRFNITHLDLRGQ